MVNAAPTLQFSYLLKKLEANQEPIQVAQGRGLAISKVATGTA